MNSYNPVTPIAHWALSDPERLALHCAGHDYSYRALIEGSVTLAGQLLALDPPLRSGARIGILGPTSIETLQAILGCLWIGSCYVPLDPSAPAQRLLSCIEQAQLDLLLITTAEQRTKTLGQSYGVPTLTVSSVVGPLPQGTRQPGLTPASISAQTPVYLMFTSGSTGTPKGVQIQAGNLKQALQALQQRIGIQASDRLSQSFPLTFDLSIFDLFMAWQQGASVHVVPPNLRLAPAGFIQQQQLSCWFSVPSVAGFMGRLGQLKADAFPSLRNSLFCGEALPCAVAASWALSAPQSQLINLYGPTEATIACFSQHYLGENSASALPVAIGTPVEGLYAAVVDEQYRFLPQGQSGQLLISGLQVCAGYWHAAEQTQMAFKSLEHPAYGLRSWYLTGDNVYADERGCWHFLGRIDRQIKVRGVRTELDEVELQFNNNLTPHAAAIIPLFNEQGLCMELCAVIETGQPLEPALLQDQLSRLGIDRRELLANLKTHIVTEALPSRWQLLEQLPRTAHGKIDYRQLIADFNLVNQDKPLLHSDENIACADAGCRGAIKPES